MAETRASTTEEKMERLKNIKNHRSPRTVRSPRPEEDNSPRGGRTTKLDRDEDDYEELISELWNINRGLTQSMRKISHPKQEGLSWSTIHARRKKGHARLHHTFDAENERMRTLLQNDRRRKEELRRRQAAEEQMHKQDMDDRSRRRVKDEDDSAGEDGSNDDDDRFCATRHGGVGGLPCDVPSDEDEDVRWRETVKYAKNVNYVDTETLQRIERIRDIKLDIACAEERRRRKQKAKQRRLKKQEEEKRAHRSNKERKESPLRTSQRAVVDAGDDDSDEEPIELVNRSKRENRGEREGDGEHSSNESSYSDHESDDTESTTESESDSMQSSGELLPRTARGRRDKFDPTFAQGPYSTYHKSLLRQQQRLSGLLSPRHNVAGDRGSADDNRFLGYINPLSPLATWGGSQQYDYLPLYWQTRDWKKQTKQGNVQRSRQWKLHQASDYSLFNEFRNYKQVVSPTKDMQHRKHDRAGTDPNLLRNDENSIASSVSQFVRDGTPSEWIVNPASCHNVVCKEPGSPRRRQREESSLSATGSSSADQVILKPQQPNKKLRSSSSDSTPTRTPTIADPSEHSASADLLAAEKRTNESEKLSPRLRTSAEKHTSLSFQAILQKERQRLASEGDSKLTNVEEHRSVIGDDWKRGLVIVMKDDRETIIGGDVRRLMSHLADSSVQDRQFVDDFLCSFRSFLQPSELLEFLIGRYNMPPPSAVELHSAANRDAADSETALLSPRSAGEGLYDKYRPLIQLRVLNVIRKWLANHFYDFDEDPRLLARLLDFIENTLKIHQPNEQHYEALKHLLLDQASEILVGRHSPLAEIVVVMQREDVGINTEIFQKKGKIFVRSFNGIDFMDWCRIKLGMNSPAEAIDLGNSMIKQGLIRTLEKRNRKNEFKVATNLYYRFSRAGRLAYNPPLPRVPSRLQPTDKLGLMDIDAIELARQFTLYSESLYRQITPTRLVGYMHAHRKMAITHSFLGIFTFLNRWDEVAKWTTREVLSYRATSHRVAALRKLINLAKACFGYNNFYDMSAILCGLNHSSINRLKKTWKLVNKKERKVFDELSALISPDNSYKLLREMQRDAWNEHFNKAERQSHENMDSDDERKASSSGEVYGLIPYIAIYIIDLEHLSQVPETLADGSVNFSKRRIEASIFSEMIRFKEQRYNFVPIEPYRQWIENVPSRGYEIFANNETNDSKKANLKPPSQLRVSKSLDDIPEEAQRQRKEKMKGSRHGRSQGTIVAYDDKTLWQISLGLEPSDRS